MNRINKKSYLKIHMIACRIFRWLDVLFLAFTSAVILLALKKPLTAVINQFVLYVSAWPFQFLFLVFFLSSFGITRLLIKIGVFQPILPDPFLVVRLGWNWRKAISSYLMMWVKNLFYYPPCWLASFLGFVLLDSMHLALFNNAVSISGLINLYLLFALVLGFIVSQMYEFARSIDFTINRNSLGDDEKVDISLKDNDDGLMEWLLEEKPVDIFNDRFDRAILAKRVARQLLEEKTKSTCIVGGFGSGKSSILNMTEYYLYHQNELDAFSDDRFGSMYFGNIITCHIDGWGRSQGSIAMMILELTIEKVKRYVDCLSVIKLPDNYHQAISNSNTGYIATFSALFHTSKDPMRELKKLDNILCAINCRVIIFLEDLDRNIMGPSIREELPGLLDRLGDLKFISFALAVGVENNLSEFIPRVCDYQEAIV